MLDIIGRYQQIFKSFRIILLEQEVDIFRFKAELIFMDDSRLFLKEYLFENRVRKYAYHWADISGKLICRWDNSSHWPGISTFPHHKHMGDKVLESTETSTSDVLDYIKRSLDDVSTPWD